MQVIIIGHNRAEHCTVRRGDEEKHFMRSRGQLYMIMPDALTRCIRTRFGKRIKDEEVLAFSENATVPYQTGTFDTCYQPSMILGSIDVHKELIPSSFFGRGTIVARKIAKNRNAIIDLFPIVLVVGLLAWAFLGN